MSATIEYEGSPHVPVSLRWKGPAVKIYNIDDVPIANFPHSFLVQGGVATWEYIADVVDLIRNDQTPSPLLFRHRNADRLPEGNPPLLNQNEPVTPGDYVVCRSGRFSDKFRLMTDYTLSRQYRSSRHSPLCWTRVSFLFRCVR